MSLKRMITTLALAAVAAMLVTAVGAAGASAAEPEVFQKGAPLAKKVAFTSTSPEKILRTKESEVKCERDSDEGELLNSREDRVTLRFFKCKLVKPVEGPCTSIKPAELEPEEIMTNRLASKLVWLKAETVKGLALSPVEGTSFTEFECETELGPVIVNVTGSALGEIPPAEYNIEKEEYQLKFECEPPGSEKQKYRMYEEPPGTTHSDFLESEATIFGIKGAKEEACEEEVGPDKIKFTEPVEIR